MFRITRYYHGKHNGYYLDDIYPNGMQFKTKHQAELICGYLNDEHVTNLRYVVE
jgi:hypothetical protein